LSLLSDRLIEVVPNPSPLPRFFFVFFADSIVVVEEYLCCAEGIFINDGDENALQHDITANRSIDRRSIDDIIGLLFEYSMQ